MSSEELVQQRSRYLIADAGMTPMRNNVGVARHVDRTGKVRPVRYGLMNDSEELNDKFKSSDLIVPRPMLITPEWVGHVVAVFAALECKNDEDKINLNDPHTAAQKRFHDLIIGYGGFAGFVQSENDVKRILRL